mmetsp:Transcript_13958/g.34395  ORF Transcript_13958/g.34395 Transcript_13958/m.34395 type:complete len:201 (+) Transcript_13958:3460-4062(+)
MTWRMNRPASQEEPLCRPVLGTKPGLTDATHSQPGARAASSRANHTLHSLDAPYTSMPLYAGGDPSACACAKPGGHAMANSACGSCACARAPVLACSSLDTTTTRGRADARSSGSSSCVSRKCDRWLAWSVHSNPSTLRASVCCTMPALSTSASSCCVSPCTCLAAPLTLAKLFRSHTTVCSCFCWSGVRPAADSCLCAS